MYNPHRWLGPGARDIEKYFVAVSEATSTIVLEYSLPFEFGAGYNSCQGRNIAQLEIYKAAATLLRDFDFKQIDPLQEWKYEASFAALPYGWPCSVTTSLRSRHGENAK